MQPGTVVAERFSIEHQAGAGGMGTVFRARDLAEGGSVAFKVLHRQTEQDAVRFVREAKALASLVHPRIVRYVAHGVAASGELYLAMEWLEGEDLATRLGRGPLGIADSVLCARNVAEALAVAHGRAIVHRDVKPANVFLVEGRIDRLKLLDFGTARFADASRVMTKTGMLVGTAGYLAPEQARGEPGVDARVDVFASGSVLFECLTGRYAFAGENVMAVLSKILLEDAPRVRELRAEVPPALDELVARMLAKDPAARPVDGAALIAAIEALGALGDAEPPAVRAVAPGLTSGEQRLHAVILVGAPTERPDVARTLPLPSPDARLGSVQQGIAPYSGRLQRLADGGSVITLDAVGAATDLATRAARCALSVRALLLDVPVTLATGRGEARAGGWPIGEVIDRAAKLLSHAESLDAGMPTRPIHLDEVTAGLLDPRFLVETTSWGFELTGEREATESVRTLLGRETPCIGRDRELSVLSGILDECIGESVARAVLVTGPAGMGKSRLRQEFLGHQRTRWPSSAARPVLEVWAARGDSMSAGSPFGLIAQAIRGACALRDGEALVLRRQRLRSRLARHIPPEDLARVTEFLGELVGTRFDDGDRVQLRAARQDPMLMGDQMLRAWEDWVAAETRAQPVVLVLEDLHWGDLPSVKLVDSILRNLPESPFLVLALARPEALDLFPNLWAERRLQHLRLEQLSSRSSEKLVRAVLGSEATAETVGRIVSRAEGNAFYLEELIRAEASGAGEGVPGTVLAMVQARLESMPADARRVLRAASVFGQSFWQGGVAALMGGEQPQLDVAAWIAELVRGEVVLPRGEGKFPGEAEYAFRHALLREASYAMLTAADRKLGHRLAGGWLEEHGESEAIVLAEHFERGARPDRAIGWYRRAAAQALEGNDFAATLARADRGVLCGAQGEVLGALRLLQAEAHGWRGEFAEALERGLAAMRSSTPGGACWYAAAGEVANASGTLGNREQLIDVARTLRDIGAPTIVEVTATARLVRRLLFAGESELGNALIGRLRQLRPGRSLQDPVVEARLEYVRALEAMFDGDAGIYLRLCEQALGAFERAGDRRNACAQRGIVGFASLEVGANAEAERVLRETLATAQRMGLRAVAAHALHNLGPALARLGRVPEAISIENEAILEFAAQQDRRLEGGSRIYLSSILASAGELPAAEQEAEAALALLAETPSLLPYAIATRARVWLLQAKTPEALEEARRAMAFLDTPTGVEEGESLVRLTFAEALDAAGERESARVAIMGAKDRILARADRITDPALRESFLEGIPENQRTLALAGRVSVIA